MHADRPHVLTPVHRSPYKALSRSRGSVEIAGLASEKAVTMLLLCPQPRVTRLLFSPPHPHRMTMDFPLLHTPSLNHSWRIFTPREWSDTENPSACGHANICTWLQEKRGGLHNGAWEYARCHMCTVWRVYSESPELIFSLFTPLLHTHTRAHISPIFPQHAFQLGNYSGSEWSRPGH